MITAAIGLSHSPLLDRARADPIVERGFSDAVADAAAVMRDARPDAIIVFFPDHMNGFFHGDIPDFALSETADSLGDYGTAPGAIDVPGYLVRSLSASLLAQGIDVPLLSHMIVDHGAAQPMELLRTTSPVIPFFINCALAPRPSFRAVEALGKAIGIWAQAVNKRIVVIGSGGLSHDPPLPIRTAEDLDAPSAPRTLSHQERATRQMRVYDAALTFGTGEAGACRPLSPAWDNALLDALESGRTDIAADWDDQAVIEASGAGGHEVRCWVAAFAALAVAGPYDVRRRHYAPVAEWLTGMGLLAATPSVLKG